jgi:hypothetical protein
MPPVRVDEHWLERLRPEVRQRLEAQLGVRGEVRVGPQATQGTPVRPLEMRLPAPGPLARLWDWLTEPTSPPGAPRRPWRTVAYLAAAAAAAGIVGLATFGLVILWPHGRWPAPCAPGMEVAPQCLVVPPQASAAQPVPRPSTTVQEPQETAPQAETPPTPPPNPVPPIRQEPTPPGYRVVRSEEVECPPYSACRVVRVAYTLVPDHSGAH